MVAPVDFARRRQQASEAVVGAASKTTPIALWVLGLFTASAAITLAVCEPSPGLDKNTYFLALSAAFFAGVAGVITAVSVANDPHCRRAVGSRKLVYAYIAPLLIAIGLSVASVRW